MDTAGSPPVLCPSAQPGMAGSMVFGVIQGSADEPRVAWIEKPVPVTSELIALTGPLPPSQVLRLAAPCQEQACCHFDGVNCRLATRIVQLMPAVTGPDSLPPCQIRTDCRWFRQEGREACRRCPQIVTYCANPTEELSLVATPR